MTWKTALVVLGTAGSALLFSAGAANAQGADAQVKRGQTLWQNRGCAGCHSIGKSKGIAPDLAGVTQRRSREWLVNWLKDTEGMLQTDSVAIGLLKEYKGQKMPNQKISEQDTDAILAFIAATEAKQKK